MERSDPQGQTAGRLIPFIGIFVLSFLVRVVISASLSHLGLWQNPQFDAHENLAWAQALAAGDFRWPSPPTHGPAYPFFLAALLKLGGGSLGFARVAQAALGAATCVLVARAGISLFGRRAGLAAGVLLTLLGPVALVDTTFWEDGFVGFLLSAALLLLATKRTAASAFLAGVLLGTACAARPTALLFVLAALASVLFLEAWSRRPAAAAALALGVAAVLVPAVYGSSKASGRFVFVRAYGAVNVWMGNDPAGGGVQNARPDGPWDRLASEPARAGVPPSGEEAYFMRKAAQRAASDPAGLARVLLSKAVWLTQAEEPRDNHAYSFFAEESRILRMLPGFGLLFALAVASAFGKPPLRRAALPLLWIAAGAFPYLVALAGLRYRMPLAPAVSLFAGTGATLVFERFRKREWRSLALPSLVVLLALMATHIRTHSPSHVFSEEWTLDGNAWMEMGKFDEAERSLRRAIESDQNAALPVEFLGRLRLTQGRAAEAAALLEESLRMDRDSRSAHFYLGQALEALGRPADAAEAYAEALVISPDFFPARFHRGSALILAGDPAAAIPELEKAVALQPSERPPRELLTRARALAGSSSAAPAPR